MVRTKKWVEVSQDISEVGYKISFEYNQEDWNMGKGETNDVLHGKGGGINIRQKKNQDIYRLIIP